MKMLIVYIVIVSAIIYAQDKDTIRQYFLGEVEVTAAKEKNMRMVSVTKEDFSRQNLITAYDGLQFRPGIYASVNGKNDAQLSIRGFDQRQISVMIDGAPVYIPYDGSFDLNAIQLAGFSRISVSKNTHSILYGPNSMGGNINLLSDIPDKKYSSRFFYRKGISDIVSVSAGFALPEFYVTGAFGYYDTKGFELPKSFNSTLNEDGGRRDNSAYNSLSGQVKIGTNIIKNTSFAFSLNVIDNSKGVPVSVYTTRPRYWKYSDWSKTLANLMFNSSLSTSVSVKGNIFYEKFKNVLDSYDDATYTTQNKKYAFHSTYDDHSLGVNLSAYVSTELLPLTKLIFLYKRDTHNEQGNYNQLFKKYEAEIITFGAEEEIVPLKNLRSVIGLSYDRMKPLYANDSQLRNPSSSLNGNFGLYYAVSQGAEIYLNLSRKSRFPTLKEFYSELLGSYVANPDLKPEQSFNYEAGGSISFSVLNLSAAIFYNDVTDLLQITTLGNNQRQYRNITKAALAGGEMELNWSHNYFNTVLNYTYLSARNKTENADLIHRPKHIVNLMLNKLYYFGFEWSAEVSFVSRQVSANADNGVYVTLPDYLIMNLGISQILFSNYSLNLRVNNITDKLYETEYGFPRPGREISAGISAEW